MTKETKNRVHLIYGIVTSAVAVVTGICFMVSAWGLYQTGLATDTQPYTVQTIAEAFQKIAVPVYLCIALVLGGIVLNIVLPPEPKKPKVEKNRKLILERLRAKTDLAACPADLRAGIEKEEKVRNFWNILRIALIFPCAAVFLGYTCRASVWHETDFNGSMIKAFFALLICMALPFIVNVCAAFALGRSLDKSIELVRQASALAPGKATPSPAPKKVNYEAIVRYSVLVLAIGLTTYGLCTGGTVDVLAKAATICTECVGLG